MQDDVYLEIHLWIINLIKTHRIVCVKNSACVQYSAVCRVDLPTTSGAISSTVVVMIFIIFCPDLSVQRRDVSPIQPNDCAHENIH